MSKKNIEQRKQDEHRTAELARLRDDLTAANLTISRIVGERDTANSKLHDAQSAYSFRHNQACAAAQEITDLKSALAQEKFQYNCFRADLARVLVLQAFPGGLKDKTMVTRVRNRLMMELVPQMQFAKEQVADATAETELTPQQIEALGK